MPSFIVIQNLTLCAPDGRELLSHLDLALPGERVGIVGRNGVGKSTLLAALAGEVAPKAGSITCHGRVVRLRQAMRVPVGQTLADGLGLRQPLARLARILDGTAGDDDLAQADWTLDARVSETLSRFGLRSAVGALDRPLQHFSGGERTRIGLAALVLAEPDVVLLDEPTNNLDEAGRDAVADFLAGWRGCAVVASHDRALLRRLDRIVELSARGVVSYGGGYDLYIAARRAAEAVAAAEFDRAERETRAARREAQAALERQAQRDSAGRSFRRSGSDGKLALDAAKGRAERTGGRLSRLGERQNRAAAERLSHAQSGMERIERSNFKIDGADVPSGRTILTFEDVSFGHSEDVDILHGFNFSMTGAERVAVVGPNGAGKSTLLRLATGEIAPRHGAVRRYGRAVLLDQDVTLLDPRLSILENLRRRDPAAGDNACRALLARFLFRADDGLVLAGSLSGGELLRAGLAIVCGASEPPDLLILDEPTNHLDIASTEAVEAALSHFPGALLVVSHDTDFLDAIGIERRIRLGPNRDEH